MIGTTISHYNIIEKLGEGGMGEVYKAEDINLQRTVALKFFPPELTRDEDARQRFRKEAIAASALDHPNIGTIHEIVEDDEHFFIVMAFYEGETLKDKITSHSEGLTVKEALDITIQIAKGLTKAHSKGIVHRDVKPANILITEEGQVKIIDFGLAKLKGDSMLTKSGATMGTVAYMSPEQAQGLKVDHLTDVWTLGVILYEMLTGNQPFKADNELAVMYQIINEEPELITRVKREIPHQIEEILDKILAKKPYKRLLTMEEMLEKLEIAAKKLKEGLRKKPPIFRWKRKHHKNAFRTVAIALIVIAFGFFLWQSKFNEIRHVSIELLPLKSLTNGVPIIDGITDDAWEDAPRINFRITRNETGPLDSIEDLSAYFSMMWDEDNIYLFVSVTDDDINVSDPTPWLNDGIELFLDGDNSKNDLSDYPDYWPYAYDLNDDQLRFVFGKEPTSGHSNIDVSAFNFAYSQNKRGYNLEVAMPFNALQFSPSMRHLFGFEIVVLDNDLGVRQNSLRWWSSEDGEMAWKNPSLFGTAILTDNHPCDEEEFVYYPATDIRLSDNRFIATVFYDNIKMVDGVAPLANKKLLAIQELEQSGPGVFLLSKGHTYDPYDAFTILGTPFISPDDILVYPPDGSVYVSDGQAETVFKLSEQSKTPIPFVTKVTTGSPLFNPYGVAVAPASFDGPNVDPGDIIIADNGYGIYEAQAVWAANPNTGTVRAIAKGNIFIAGPILVDFTSDGTLFVSLNTDPDRMCRIVTLSANGKVAPFFEAPIFEAPQQVYSNSLAVHPKTDEIFFQKVGGEIHRISKTGGEPKLFASNIGNFQDIVFNEQGTSLYFGYRKKSQVVEIISCEEIWIGEDDDDENEDN